MKNKRLFKIGTSIGLITLTVGLGIFFTWWAGRAFFAEDYYKLEGNGFLWIFISIPSALVAFILNIIYLVQNYNTDLKKALVGIVIVLINIPAVIWVTDMQADIDQRAYLKITNIGKNEITNVTFESSFFNMGIGSLKPSESKIINYYPQYIDDRWSSYPDVKPVRVSFNTNSGTVKEIELPRVDKGDCRKLTIDDTYNLETK